jgi:hypothetical protein
MLKTNVNDVKNLKSKDFRSSVCLLNNKIGFDDL